MKNISIWKDTVKENKYPELSSNKTTDVLIIGGGITGASTFYYLKNSGLKVILVDQNKIGFSTTGSSTGKLNYLQNNLIDKIRSSVGDEEAFRYVESQRYIINEIVNIINTNNIDCDLEKINNYLYTDKESEISKLKNLEKFLVKNGIEVKKGSKDIVNSKYMYYASDTYIFHPIKFVYGLLSNMKDIYENTSIKKIVEDGNGYVCHTDKYKIKAKKIVLASHYPYFNIPFLFPIKSSLEKSYLSASINKYGPVSLISYSNPFVSLRSYKDYLIYLSNSHSINTKVCDKKHFDELKKKIHDLNLKEEYLWSNIDIMTNDGLPYIGEIKNNIFIGTGYNTWGLTNGVLAGKIISDNIIGIKNKYSDLFDPKRINLNKFLGIFDDVYKSIEGYISGHFGKNDKINYKKNNGDAVMEYNGKEYSYRCSHLGCKLIYNEVENTFDCPCHGSRFDINGKCIMSPSNYDIDRKM